MNTAARVMRVLFFVYARAQREHCTEAFECERALVAVPAVSRALEQIARTCARCARRPGPLLNPLRGRDTSFGAGDGEREVDGGPDGTRVRAVALEESFEKGTLLLPAARPAFYPRLAQ